MEGVAPARWGSAKDRGPARGPEGTSMSKIEADKDERQQCFPTQSFPTQSTGLGLASSELPGGQGDQGRGGEEEGDQHPSVFSAVRLNRG
jgi:hypothetical protein